LCKKRKTHLIFISFFFSSWSISPRSDPIDLSLLAPMPLDSLETVLCLVTFHLTGKQDNKREL